MAKSLKSCKEQDPSGPPPLRLHVFDWSADQEGDNLTPLQTHLS